MECFGNEENFRKRKCIDDRETLMRKTNVFFGQKHRPVQLKKSQDHPKIERDAKELLQLVIGFLLQGSGCCIHVHFLLIFAARVTEFITNIVY